MGTYNLKFIFNTAQTTVVSYDDTYSIASKTRFAKKSGMAGCFSWSMDQVRCVLSFWEGISKVPTRTTELHCTM